VFQFAGPETPGLLADITELLSHNGLDIRTAAAWTFRGRAAIVLGVTERGAAVVDSLKLQRLQQLLEKLASPQHGGAAVSVEQVRHMHQLCALPSSPLLSPPLPSTPAVTVISLTSTALLSTH
jgi:hypothetical protein